MTSTPTVRELFVTSGNGDLAAGLRLPPPEGAAKLLTAFEWQGLGERVVDLLNINVIDVLLGGWKQHQEVREQLRRTAADPRLTALVSLAKHTIESTHTPSIELRAQGRKVMEVSFPLKLAFEIEAVELTLRQGAIRELRPGTIKVRGTVKLEKTVILNRELSAMTLPGRITIYEPAQEAEPAIVGEVAMA